MILELRTNVYTLSLKNWYKVLEYIKDPNPFTINFETFNDSVVIYITRDTLIFDAGFIISKFPFDTYKEMIVQNFENIVNHQLVKDYYDNNLI